MRRALRALRKPARYLCQKEKLRNLFAPHSTESCNSRERRTNQTLGREVKLVNTPSHLQFAPPDFYQKTRIWHGYGHSDPEALVERPPQYSVRCRWKHNLAEPGGEGEGKREKARERQREEREAFHKAARRRVRAGRRVVCVGCGRK